MKVRRLKARPKQVLEVYSLLYAVTAFHCIRLLGALGMAPASSPFLPKCSSVGLSGMGGGPLIRTYFVN
jgi:hypothetical protein